MFELLMNSGPFVVLLAGLASLFGVYLRGRKDGRGAEREKARRVEERAMQDRRDADAEVNRLDSGSVRKRLRERWHRL